MVLQTKEQAKSKEPKKIIDIKGVYTSTTVLITGFYIAYEGMFGSQALEITKADYKLLVGVMDIPELNI